MKVDVGSQTVVEENARILRIYTKVCDEFSADLLDDQGRVLKDYEGYVPEFMPGDHYGDYIILRIDIENGQILNWDVPTKKQIEDFIAGKSDR